MDERVRRAIAAERLAIGEGTREVDRPRSIAAARGLRGADGAPDRARRRAWTAPKVALESGWTL